MIKFWLCIYLLVNWNRHIILLLNDISAEPSQCSALEISFTRNIPNIICDISVSYINRCSIIQSGVLPSPWTVWWLIEKCGLKPSFAIKRGLSLLKINCAWIDLICYDWILLWIKRSGRCVWWCRGERIRWRASSYGTEWQIIGICRISAKEGRIRLNYTYSGSIW